MCELKVGGCYAFAKKKLHIQQIMLPDGDKSSKRRQYSSVRFQIRLEL